MSDLIKTAFGAEQNPEYTFFASQGMNGVAINLTLIVTIVENDVNVPETTSPVLETTQPEPELAQGIPGPMTASITRMASRGKVMSLQNLSVNLDAILENLETAVEESEIFEAIGE